MAPLIVYGILAAVSFLIFTIASEIVSKLSAGQAGRASVTPNYIMLVVMAVIWPLAWVSIIVHCTMAISKE